jgi:deazaflavin-dependent oxidoreductase (nitroreductase family)
LLQTQLHALWRRRDQPDATAQGQEIQVDDTIQRALSRGSLIDITTIGRRTARPHRIELVFHNFDGHVYISGRPGPRDWYANLLANPAFTFHLKRGISADLPARARPITDEAERRAVLEKVGRAWGVRDVGRMVRSSPLVEVEFLDKAA